MNNQELLDKSKELVKKIYDNMAKVESYQTLIGTLAEGTACFNHPEKGVIIMTDFLDDNQMVELRNIATGMLNDNMSKSMDFLTTVTGSKQDDVKTTPEITVKPEEPLKVTTKPEVKKETQEITTKNTVGKPSRMNIDEVKKYIADGKTNQEIADIYGYKSDSTVTYFLKKNGLEKKPNAKDLKLDDGKISACYVKGPFTLKQLAEEFGMDKKTMYEYCELHNLVKIQQKDMR